MTTDSTEAARERREVIDGLKDVQQIVDGGDFAAIEAAIVMLSAGTFKEGIALASARARKFGDHLCASRIERLTQPGDPA